MYVVVLFPCTASGEGEFTPRNVNDAPRILAIFAELVSRSIVQGGKREVAAFVVRDDDGEFKCYLWPRGTDALQQSFTGRLPAGTVAIAQRDTRGKPNTRLDIIDRPVAGSNAWIARRVRTKIGKRVARAAERLPAACVHSAVWRAAPSKWASSATR